MAQRANAVAAPTIVAPMVLAVVLVALAIIVASTPEEAPSGDEALHADDSPVLDHDPIVDDAAMGPPEAIEEEVPQVNGDASSPSTRSQRAGSEAPENGVVQGTLVQSAPIGARTRPTTPPPSQRKFTCFSMSPLSSPPGGGSSSERPPTQEPTRLEESRTPSAPARTSTSRRSDRSRSPSASEPRGFERSRTPLPPSRTIARPRGGKAPNSSRVLMPIGFERLQELSSSPPPTQQQPNLGKSMFRSMLDYCQCTLMGHDPGAVHDCGKERTCWKKVSPHHPYNIGGAANHVFFRDACAG